MTFQHPSLPIPWLRLPTLPTLQNVPCRCPHVIQRQHRKTWDLQGSLHNGQESISRINQWLVNQQSLDSAQVNYWQYDKPGCDTPYLGFQNGIPIHLNGIDVHPENGDTRKTLQKEAALTIYLLIPGHCWNPRSLGNLTQHEVTVGTQEIVLLSLCNHAISA